jgi:UPF0271 protein
MDSVNTTATIDLNVDFGESDRGSPSPNELAILGLASSVNLSCGVHAGNVPLLRAILRVAASMPVALGAHPSYDDRLNFGRRETGLPASAIEPLVTAQVLALMTLAREAGVRIRYIKAHGALYHRTAHDAEAAAALCRAALGIDSRPLPLLGPGEGSELERVAKRAGVPFFREGFLDRGYRADGKLVPRGEEGALINDSTEASARAVAIARGESIAAVDGSRVTITADSLCIHGESAAALAHVKAAREALRSASVDVLPFAP